MTGRTPVELSRRNGGGVRLDQGPSFILLNRDEALQLIYDIHDMIAGPAEATKSART